MWNEKEYKTLGNWGARRLKRNIWEHYWGNQQETVVQILAGKQFYNQYFEFISSNEERTQSQMLLIKINYFKMGERNSILK